MGGRGASGATYARKIAAAKAIRGIDERIKALEEEADKSAQEYAAWDIHDDKWRTANGSILGSIESKLEGKRDERDAYLDNSDLARLKEKRARHVDELKMVLNGQRALF